MIICSPTTVNFTAFLGGVADFECTLLSTALTGCTILGARVTRVMYHEPARCSSVGTIFFSLKAPERGGGGNFFSLLTLPNFGSQKDLGP